VFGKLPLLDAGGGVAKSAISLHFGLLCHIPHRPQLMSRRKK
jgi:hypothetical protein